MKCPACGFENESNGKFCGNCGVMLPGSSARLYCTNCGQENPPDATFCQECGSEIIQPEKEPRAASKSPSTAPLPFQNQSAKRSANWKWLFGGAAAMLIAVGVFAYLALRDVSGQSETSSISNQGSTAFPLSTRSPAVCSPGEVELYREDFEDGSAREWTGIPDGTGFYSIGPAFDDEENLALIVRKPEGATGQLQATPKLQITPFSNALLRIRFYLTGYQTARDAETDWFSFNWLDILQPVTLDGQNVFDSRYQLPIGWNYFGMRRLQQPLSNVGVDDTGRPANDTWHSLEIATYQPRTEVWLDGKRVMMHEDPDPLPPGTFSIETWIKDSDMQLMFDDIFICELNAPYAL